MATVHRPLLPFRSRPSPESVSRGLACAAAALLIGLFPARGAVHAQAPPDEAALAVERILAEERQVLASQETGDREEEELQDILEDLEALEALETPVPAVSGKTPDAGTVENQRFLDQTVRVGVLSADLRAAGQTIPTTAERTLTWEVDYVFIRNPRWEVEIRNDFLLSDLRTRNFLDNWTTWTPEKRFRAQLRNHLELEKNGSRQLSNDYELGASELTVEYDFPFGLSTSVRTYVEAKDFDVEGNFNFSSRTLNTQYTIERRRGLGSTSVDLIREQQTFDLDPTSSFQRDTLTLWTRGPLSSRLDGELRFRRSQNDRNIPLEVLDSTDSVSTFVLEWRFTSNWSLRLQQEFGTLTFEAPDDINFNLERVSFLPTLTYVPRPALSLTLDARVEKRRNFDLDPTDFVQEADEDRDVLGFLISAFYTYKDLFATGSIGYTRNDHVLPDNFLQADFRTFEWSLGLTYNFSPDRFVTANFSSARDTYSEVAAANNSKSTFLTADYTVRF